MLKEHSRKEIIEMQCVGHFIVLMITKKLMQSLFKPCGVFFITIIQY